MITLKKDFSSPSDVSKNEHLENKFLYEGYPNNTQLVRIKYVECHESQKGKKNIVETKELSLGKLNIPKGLSLVEAVKTISYVFDQVTKKTKSNNLLLTSQLTKHCLSQYHFADVSENARKKEKCLTLYFVGGNQQLLSLTNHFDNYTDWYVSNVSRDEVKSTYQNSGLNFPKSTKINFEPETELGEE